MTKKHIVVGDPTTHGGVVISGAANAKIAGKPIARLGDLVDCPQLWPDRSPHGVNPIVEGDPSCLVEGQPAALEGHTTACGCALIGTTTSTHS